MTDEHRPGPGEEDDSDPGLDPQPDPDLAPGTEAEVRRLLREARETGPPPPDVVARLDATLASLREEPGEGQGEGQGEEPGEEPETGAAAPVVVLPRRRVRQVVLGAAAAVAVVAVGVPVTLSVTGSDGETGSTVSVEGAAEGDAAPEADTGPGNQPPGLLASPDAERGGQVEGGPAGDEAAPPGGELLLGRVDFDAQVTAFVERGGIGPVPAAACGAPPDGRRIAARYEGALGTLLLTPSADGIRARLYVCGDEGVIRSVDVAVE